MRQILDTEGGAQTNGLRSALHICRGHFKSYTEDAPLFGKHTGTYWWADRVRGDRSRGRVEKDYAVKLDAEGLGRSYRDAEEAPPSAREYKGGDPDLSGRGVVAHNKLQNQLAAAVRAAGHEPLSPRPQDPQFDLAWIDGDVIWVVEVKSLTVHNELSQMHQAIGQVTDYAHRIDPGDRTVLKAIAVERQPEGAHWLDLLASQGLALAWPGVLHTIIGTAGEDGEG
jgi:hypothetical protein